MLRLAGLLKPARRLRHDFFSKNPECFLLAVASADIHPARLAGFAVRGCHLVINGRDASSAEGVHVSQRTLVMTWSLGYLLLSYR